MKNRITKFIEENLELFEYAIVESRDTPNAEEKAKIIHYFYQDGDFDTLEWEKAEQLLRKMIKKYDFSSWKLIRKRSGQ